MAQLTPSETTLLRTRPHNTKLWLSVYQPTTTLAARVNNASATKNDRFIPYDSVTAGSYLLIQEGMTLMVGSGLGSNDKGEVRIRSASVSGVVVAENSYIDWDDNDFLTAKNFYEIQAVFPRIITDPNDATQTIWYKDYDIEYTNQNTVMGSFICMGSHYAGFLGGTGTCSVYYTATGTSYIGNSASTLSYHWFFEGANTTGSSALTPGYIDYTTPGHYTTRLIVSGSAGNVDTSYRHVSIYDRPNEGNDVPILDWSITKLTGARDAGGYTASIRVFEELSTNEIMDGSLVVIFSDDWYGSTKQSMGRNSINRSNIVFVGYVLNGSINYNYKEHYLDFEATSPTGLMKISKGFSISLEDIDDPVTRATNDPGNYPSAWALIPGLNIQKSIWHYLKWHSTVLKCIDVQFLGTDQRIQYFDADRESIYNVVDTAVKGTLLGKAVSDIQGKLWVETDAYIESKPLNTFVLDNQDWMGEPKVEIKQINDVSFIEIGGISYTSFTGTSTPYLSAAPGESPSYQGEIERIQGLALSSQAHLNTIAANLYAHKNRKYPKLDFNIAGNYSLFDIAPLEQYYINVPPNFNPFGAYITGYYHVDGVAWNYNPRTESFLPNVNFSQISTGTFSDTLAIPPLPEEQGYSVPPISIPPISIPPITIGGTGGVVSPILVPAQHSIASDNTDDGENSDAWHHAGMSTVGGTGAGAIQLSGTGAHRNAGATFAIPSTASSVLVYPLFFKPYGASTSTTLTLSVSKFQLNTNATNVDYTLTKNYDLDSLTYNLDYWRPDDLLLSTAVAGYQILLLGIEYLKGAGSGLLPFLGWLVYIT